VQTGRNETFSERYTLFDGKMCLFKKANTSRHAYKDIFQAFLLRIAVKGKTEGKMDVWNVGKTV
jgi:prolyl-tRNA synthetase